MLSAIIGALTIVGSFVKRFVIDYISNIVVGTMLFPLKVIEQGSKNMQSVLLK